MKEENVNTGRRRATGIILASATLSLIGLLRPGVARADDLPHLTQDDPIAKALNYTPDASKADRTDKLGVPGNQQHCGVCQFLQGADGSEWRPCQLFPGKLVNANGWCSSWTPKAKAG